MSKSLIAAFALSLCFGVLPGQAETPDMPEVAADSIGPVVGQPAPDFSSATRVTAPGVAPRAGELGTALVFFRSADWCPFCKAQLMELEDIARPLEEAGWAMEGISYDAPETLIEFAEDKELSFALRSDEGSEVIAAFGLLNEDVREGSRSYGIPHPAVVFVRENGTVAAVLREEGYRTRPSTEAILNTATQLSAMN
ncbi:MAG: peroxiredoxin family protein [Hyphomonadaceae bacterium]|nr:peroxiredoxin family protein [Hyphomonadaceae bacterium]